MSTVFVSGFWKMFVLMFSFVVLEMQLPEGVL